MKQTLLMERVMDQTRVAVIEEGALSELFYECTNPVETCGNIYLGRVQNTLPGMNAAFVDIGLPKKGFLSAGDIQLEAHGTDGMAEMLKNARIEKLAKPGQDLLVQVIKSQTGSKGPRLSCHITLPGRLTVLLPGLQYVGVSRKITDSDTRERLYGAGKVLTDGTDNGIILRTASEMADFNALREDYERLCQQLALIQKHTEYAKAPKLVYNDNALSVKLVRDLLNSNVETVWIDDAICYNEALQYALMLAPEMAERFQLHDGETPLFDLYRVDAQAEKALQKYIWLKSGGSVIIEETEALTVIDVNTGKNAGRRDAEETVFETNCEAAREVMRQLRLRDIGGIIVVDFIDMRLENHRQALLDLLKQCAAQDRNRTSVVDITRLGLVELTRKKARPSQLHQMTCACSKCNGNGTVLSDEYAARKAVRAIWRRRRRGDDSPLEIAAAMPVCKWIQKIGMPNGGRVILKPVDDLEPGDYQITPIACADLK